MSLCGFSGQGIEGPLGLLAAVAELLVKAALPYGIAGYIEVEPQDLQRTGWLSTIGGRIVAPAEATTDTRKVYDYPVMDLVLAGQVESVKPFHGTGMAIKYNRPAASEPLKEKDTSKS